MHPCPIQSFTDACRLDDSNRATSTQQNPHCMPIYIDGGLAPYLSTQRSRIFFFFLVNVFLNLRDLDMFHVNLKFSKCFISASKMLKIFHLNFIVSYCFIKTLGFWISFIQTFYFYFYFFYDKKFHLNQCLMVLIERICQKFNELF